MRLHFILEIMKNSTFKLTSQANESTFVQIWRLSCWKISVETKFFDIFWLCTKTEQLDHAYQMKWKRNKPDCSSCKRLFSTIWNILPYSLCYQVFPPTIMASSDSKYNVISENKIKVVLIKKIIFVKLLTDRIIQDFRNGLQYSEKFRITQELN